MRILVCAAVLTAAMSVGATASAQAVATPSPTPASPGATTLPSLAPPPAPAPAVVPSGTIVTIEITDLVSTRTVKRGDTFPIRLASPILLGDRVVVPAGAPGIGQVVDAAPSGALGKPAKLLLAARYLDLNGSHVPLHAMRLIVEGQDNTNAIFVASFVPYVGILAGFAHGGEIDIPAKTQALAKLGADLPAIPVSATTGPATVASAQPPAIPLKPDEKGTTP